jgi:large subunit ribosomal protein L3
LKKASVNPVKVLKEIRVDTVDDYQLGQDLQTAGFSEGDKIDISGVSKGKGFQGGVKRHNWGGGRKTHGSMFHRRIGAISAGTGQARIFKGKTLPGHMGNIKVTLQNLEIVKIDSEHNIFYIKGGIPGPNGGMVFIRETHKKPKKVQAK